MAIDDGENMDLGDDAEMLMDTPMATTDVKHGYYLCQCREFKDTDCFQY